MTALRLAVLSDYPEEGWPSMDLCAEQLLAGLPPGVAPERVCPPFRRRLGRLPLPRRLAFNADRLLNRHADFPSHLRGRARWFDAFHVVDHSYAQLVHALPPGRAGVFCHDLDAFRCLLDPRRDPRPRWFRLLARRVLAGLRKAVAVFYATDAVRAEAERFGLLDPARLVYAPYGVAAEFLAESGSEDDAVRAGVPYLLHVGSCVPRKRVDVLLDVFAAVRAGRPGLRLVQVGGDWTPAQRDQIRRLDLTGAVAQERGVSRARLAAWYRGAAAVLQPSEAEGFGLPVAEALACGAAVVASDLPVLREVGGDAARYCPVADVPAWADAVGRVLDDPGAAPPPAARRAHGRRFSWPAHAATVADAYRRLAGRGAAP
jgi:glycosyltransferase involved in cell wall biosynthesis